MTGWHLSRLQVTINIVFDHDGSAAAELGHFESGSLRIIRLDAKFGVDNIECILRLDHCVRYIETPDVLGAEEKQHALSLTGHLRSDKTAQKNLFLAYVRNGVAGW